MKSKRAEWDIGRGWCGVTAKSSLQVVFSFLYKKTLWLWDHFCQNRDSLIQPCGEEVTRPKSEATEGTVQHVQIRTELLSDDTDVFILKARMRLFFIDVWSSYVTVRVWRAALVRCFSESGNNSCWKCFGSSLPLITHDHPMSRAYCKAEPNRQTFHRLSWWKMLKDLIWSNKKSRL